MVVDGKELGCIEQFRVLGYGTISGRRGAEVRGNLKAVAVSVDYKTNSGPSQLKVAIENIILTEQRKRSPARKKENPTFHNPKLGGLLN